ncbi:MAG: hypothetical protein PHT40_00030 [Patescibacteria group bacterium]|nr:hypothetical protein [Patescibacteria group bacterium]
MRNLPAKIFKNTFTVALTVIVSSFLVVGVVAASTTISTNIVTDGTITAATKIGAATTTPFYPLDVNGDIHQIGTAKFYQNYLPVFVASSTIKSVSVGTEAGKVLDNNGIENVFVGYQAGLIATSSVENTVIGTQAMGNAWGGIKGALGFNVAVGYQALYSDTVGYNNIAVGYQALYDNTEGADNVAVGTWSLANNTTGNFNTAMGRDSLYVNTTGRENVAFGMQTLNANTIGNYNTAIGKDTLSGSVNGSNNSALGFQALNWMTEGSWNTALGSYALGQTYTKSFANTAVGFEAGLTNGNSPYYSNASSTWIGYQAGKNIRTGSSNIALGYKAAEALTTGSNNIVIGYDVDARAVDASNTLNIGNILFGDNLVGTDTTIRGRIGIATSTPWRTNLMDYGFVVATSTLIDANATTTGNFIIGDGNTTPTSTLEIGGGTVAGCLKIRDANADAWTYCYTDDGNLRCTTEDVCNK